MPKARKKSIKKHDGEASFAAVEPTFAVFTDACWAHGIARTTAYELLEAGAFETFLIGRRRYVTLESLRKLPQTMQDPEFIARLSAIKSGAPGGGSDA